MKNSIKFFGVLALMLLMAAPAMAADFNMSDALAKFWNDMGITSFFVGEGWKNAVMLGIGCFLLYLAIKKEYEPLLLLPIAFGMLLVNIYPDIMAPIGEDGHAGGLLYYFYLLDVGQKNHNSCLLFII